MRESNINIDLRHIWVTTPSAGGKRRVLLKNVDLTVSEGELVYLIGKVGSGKSTLMKMLYGEAPLTHGDGYVAGFSLNRLARRTIPMLRRKLGMVFQDFQLLNDRTVYQNMRFVLLATGWRDEQHIKERIDETLSMVGLLHKSGSMPHQLSGGEQQRIAVGRAFINRPAVILADEPTGNLDPETAADIMELFMEIASRGCSVIFATHNISMIEQYPARIIRINNNTLEEVEHSAVFGTHGSPALQRGVPGTFRRQHDSPLFSVSGLSTEQTTFAIGGMATAPASFAPNGAYPEPATFSMPERRPYTESHTEVLPVNVVSHRHPAPAAFGTPDNGHQPDPSTFEAPTDPLRSFKPHNSPAAYSVPQEHPYTQPIRYPATEEPHKQYIITPYVAGGALAAMPGLFSTPWQYHRPATPAPSPADAATRARQWVEDDFENDLALSVTEPHISSYKGFATDNIFQSDLEPHNVTLDDTAADFIDDDTPAETDEYDIMSGHDIFDNLMPGGDFIHEDDLISGPTLPDDDNFLENNDFLEDNNFMDDDPTDSVSPWSEPDGDEYI